MKDLTEQLQKGFHLTEPQVAQACRELAASATPEEEKIEFLLALKEKGETGEELGYFAKAFVQMAVSPGLDLDGRPTIDVCGTGGDRLELINVSTTVGFIVAASDVVLVKHGNRAMTSRSGGADVLEQLGIPVDCPIETMARCIEEIGVGFLFAPLYHPAFAAVAGVRKALAERGVATIFNLLGPMLNPARPDYQLVGVFSPVIQEKYAIALGQLGRRTAWVVHGQVPSGSGMDEISTLGETEVHQVKDGGYQRFHLFSDQFNFRPASLHELRGGGPAENAQHLTAILSGADRGARRDLVVFNAAAALVIAEKAERMETAVPLAVELIDSGAALQKLRAFQKFFSSSV